MSTNTKEIGLEQHITDYLVSANNYVLCTSQDYDNVNCIDSDMQFQFLENTQPKAIEKHKRYHKDVHPQQNGQFYFSN